MTDRYLQAQFYLGVLAGSLRKPWSDDAKKALEFFDEMITRYLDQDVDPAEAAEAAIASIND